MYVVLGLVFDILSISAESTIVNDKITGKKTHKVASNQVKNVLKTEIKGIHPVVENQIATSLLNSNIDHQKYRDILFIKKHIIDDGNRQITEYDITERIIPKQPQFSNLVDSIYLKILFLFIILMLGVLVFTTTLKLYQNIIKLKYIKKATKKNFQSQKILNGEINSSI